MHLALRLRQKKQNKDDSGIAELAFHSNYSCKIVNLFNNPWVFTSVHILGYVCTSLWFLHSELCQDWHTKITVYLTYAWVGMWAVGLTPNSAYLNCTWPTIVIRSYIELIISYTIHGCSTVLLVDYGSFTVSSRLRHASFLSGRN